MMTSDKVLCYYDPKKPVKLACDAFPYGLGSVLSHLMDDGTERSIAFASRSLTKAERAYSQIDKVVLRSPEVSYLPLRASFNVGHRPLTSSGHVEP